MNERKERNPLKKTKAVEQSVEDEILEALSDFTDALGKEMLPRGLVVGRSN